MLTQTKYTTHLMYAYRLTVFYTVYTLLPFANSTRKFVFIAKSNWIFMAEKQQIISRSHVNEISEAINQLKL